MKLLFSKDSLELQRLIQETNEVSATVALDLTIVHIDISRMNSFEERGNDRIHVRVEQSNLYFWLNILQYVVLH
jgi:hypothetical protein